MTLIQIIRHYSLVGVLDSRYHCEMYDAEMARIGLWDNLQLSNQWRRSAACHMLQCWTKHCKLPCNLCNLC